MSVFITGATGVLGRPVVRQLRKQGRTVKALSRSAANHEMLESLGAIPVEADLFDAHALARVMAGCDTVLHLATRIPASSKLKKRGVWDENDRIRREGTAAVVEAAEQAGVGTTLYPSVSLFYASAGDTWIDATNAMQDVTGPPRSTLDAEATVAEFAAGSSDRRGIVLRFGTFYGPTSADSRQMLAMAHKGIAMPLAPPSAYRSLIWIDDAASAVVAACDRAPSGTFDVVEDDPSTQAQAQAALAHAVGRKSLWTLPRWLLRLFLPADLRELAARSQRISSARFRDATAWRPTVPNQKVGWLRMAEAAARDALPQPPLGRSDHRVGAT